METPTRRRFLATAGTAVGAGAGLAGLASQTERASAHTTEPSADWRPAAEGNYEPANREADYDVRWVIVHVTQGSYSGAINWFQNPDSGVSAHYVIRNADGARTKLLELDDVGYHAGNLGYNRTSIGLEHEGYVGETTFTDDLYVASAEVVRHVADRFDVPLVHPSGVAPCDEGSGIGGIVGHDQVPDPYDCSSGGGAGRHTDPGSTWNWDRYMDLIQGVDLGARFAVDERVSTTADLNVRDAPTLDGSVVGTAPLGTDATITDGYQIAEGYVWWKLEYDDGLVGWSVDRYLASNLL